LALKKLEILGNIVAETTVNAVLKELYIYAHYENEVVSTESVAMIGKCSLNNPKLADLCTKSLILLLKSKS